MTHEELIQYAKQLENDVEELHRTVDQMFNRTQELQAGIKQRDEVILRQVRWLDAMSRSRRDEPVFMDAMPILDAYATDMITGSRARELLKLWVRGMERMALLVELEGTNTIKENTK